MTDTEIIDLSAQFQQIAKDSISRKGINELLQWLDTTDFYVAPASTRYHGSEAGGLLKHSLSVHQWAYDIMDGISYSSERLFEALDFNLESLALVTLFHDVCKVGAYKLSMRNVKNEQTGEWERVPYYTYTNGDKFGAHGAKSVFILSQFIKLTEAEAVAILHHMGAWDKSTYSDPGKAYENNTLAWILHVADEAATYISKT